MFKTGLSISLYREFLSSYQGSSQNHHSSSTVPYVYADKDGIKYIASMIDQDGSEGDIFATSVAEDGWIEYLSLS